MPSACCHSGIIVRITSDARKITNPINPAPMADLYGPAPRLSKPLPTIVDMNNGIAHMNGMKLDTWNIRPTPISGNEIVPKPTARYPSGNTKKMQSGINIFSKSIHSLWFLWQAMAVIVVYHPIMSDHIDIPRLSLGDMTTVMNAITKNAPCNAMTSFYDAVRPWRLGNNFFIRFFMSDVCFL